MHVFLVKLGTNILKHHISAALQMRIISSGSAPGQINQKTVTVIIITLNAVHIISVE